MGTPPQATAPLAGPVPVAVLARTSTMQLQDPIASIRRQIRSCAGWLPAGWRIVAHFWDVESGGLDLEQRGHGTGYEQFTAAGLPRDGGLADLLTEAGSPQPRFAAVVVEDIERASRDTFNSLKLEKQLSEQGIPLFATDEPADIAGVSPTAILVRRVKQGVAEWYRLQLKEKAWKGLREHAADGWNIGTAPYGYHIEHVAHPNPVKAAQGKTKPRLVLDPARAPVVAQVYRWRVADRLGIPTICARLNADPHAYPPPPKAGGWNPTTVLTVLRNPKYTGHQVFGRITTSTGRTRPVPPSEWLWTPDPVHPAIVDRPMWDAAQAISADRGNIRDPEILTSRPGRRYVLRSRVRCRA